MPCYPNCHSERGIKNGLIQTGKPKLACKEWGRQFGENLFISVATKVLIERLFLEKTRWLALPAPWGLRRLAANLCE